VFGPSEDGDVGVVVELREGFLAPPDDYGVAGAKADAHGRLEALRPRPDRPGWGGRPVVRPHEAPHLAAACQAVVGKGFWWRHWQHPAVRVPTFGNAQTRPSHVLACGTHQAFVSG
jgi:hypothetical protein